MPEYLAPGVYVEETSFRAKSIEGVSTSTTAFVGPTRKGPYGVTPELLTSFGDFERIYGGLEDLDGSLNYMAHAVRAYFDNGGSRLYVSRVFTPLAGNDGKATSANLVNGGAQAQFVARFPGVAGNGQITLTEMDVPATVTVLSSAPTGAMLRIGGSAAQGARMQGSAPPYSLPNNGVLHLLVDGAATPQVITFTGVPAEAISGAALANPLNLTDPATLTVRIGSSGQPQTITLPTGATVTPADVASAINRQMRGGYARLTDAGDAVGVGHLAIGTDQQGKSAAITVSANPQLGFTGDTTVTGAANSANSVNDLGQVTVGDIDALLQAANAGVRAVLSGGNLVLTTTDTSASSSLQIQDDPHSVHTALGLQAGNTTHGTAGATPKYYIKRANAWQDSQNNTLDTSTLQPAGGAASQLDFLSMTVVAQDTDGNQLMYEDLGFDQSHPRFIGHVMPARPTRMADSLENMFAINVDPNVNAVTLYQGIFDLQPQRNVTLAGGNNGMTPSVADYEAALQQLEMLDDVSIVAAPGHSAYDQTTYLGIQAALIVHVEKRRSYRIAVLDTPPGLDIGGAREARSHIDSTYAAMYYPWVTIANPVARPGDQSIPQEINLPPSGFVCGVYARTDIERGVFKAPANEVVLGALRFESDVNFAQQEVLNPVGVNCLRYFPNRGNRIWGARTVSSDPEWKYVNVRRYFNYLEHSIDNGTQWAVFEPNGERLWANVRDTISAFLQNEWVSGALLGSRAEDAFFARCDRSTMTQNDLDNGRMICLVGVAVLKPAEFVIFRIGQKTVDARS